ncbi:MAG: type I DNA topoisomerase [Pseudomonadales bacterium]|jgi:DNA topoisomerase-1|nr:type I DNA topoisomerase [Pseudomonadales bacterium]
MRLVIVESPTKARKLSSFLGKDYKVESSVGHVVDLPKSKLGVDVDNNFEPVYEVSKDKGKVVSTLTSLAKKADQIYLASDPDREGEAIAWHLQNLLTEGDHKVAKKSQFKRATFNEITKDAVLDAMANPGQLNLDLVDAQQARRVLDRLVGYKVSPVLWKKVRRGLSAGRVQSVALRLIVEREKEITAFVPEEYWEVGVILSPDKVGKTLKVDQLVRDQLESPLFFTELTQKNGKKYEPKKAADVEPVVVDLQKATYVVHKIEKKERKRNAFAPFITSTLQQTAANKLGFTSKQTMTLAQQLYEEGLITYHRTDSYNLSDKAVAEARGYIGKEFGDNYVPSVPNFYGKKSKNAQEAHEAIRVTEIGKREIDASSYSRFSPGHEKLYNLIWRRFMASQMTPAVYDQTAVTINAKHDKNSYDLKCNGSQLKFDGWTRLFENSEDRILPALEEGQVVEHVRTDSEQKFTQPPARYNDASIIKKLEELGIGRPSTYASIISVIIDRGYVDRQQRKFMATPIGITVSDFLMQNMREMVEYDFTAQMEESLDEISRGEKKWQQVIGDFYKPFAKKLEKVDKDAERMKVPVEETGEDCPLCFETEQGKVVLRTGRFGKFKSCSRYPECKYTENIVEKLEGQQCPLCGDGDIIIKPSRYGKNFFGCEKYPECTWASWSKPEPGLKITKAEWAEMQAAREARKAAREKNKAEKAGSTGTKKTAAKKATKKKTTTKKTTAKKTTKTAKKS